MERSAFRFCLYNKDIKRNSHRNDWKLRRCCDCVLWNAESGRCGKYYMICKYDDNCKSFKEKINEPEINRASC